MKFEFLDRRSAERFAELIDEAGGVPRHHTRGQTDEELNRLVAIGNRLGTARPVAPVDSEFRVGLRAMLVATAERDGIGLTAVNDAAPVADTVDGARRSFFGRRIRARGAIVIGVAAGAMAVSGISAASESASPGDALYGVKRSTERAQLAIAGSDVSRGQLSLDFARNRLTEAVAMDGDDPAFRTVLDDMDADTRKGVRLLNTAVVSNKDRKPLTTLNGFVSTQRKAFEPAIDELSPANRDRAAASLALLQDVTARSEQLRTGLNCEKITPNGSDELGPKLRDCDGDSNAGAGTQSKPGHTGGGSKSSSKNNEDPDATPKPSKSGITAKPDVSGDATLPSTVAPTTPATNKKPTKTSTVTPSPSETVTTPPVVIDEEQDSGVLDGLLDNLF
ncbi:hypothetical protein FB565_005662 [Actinoplanes lutulentus]|uniref:DUF5667 domain-containing protein n=1 Tax=Actinoplanes lutulentus TaxID=1287878 RepID=A0A327ZIB4_9ACTN|nr:DUF5667 domain-containing protein [Actinoplanes lutulentus]MBB2945904.1 hypothetical protein [Actinoplanes lutulentus]RAK37953.1 hypothetical protein B0I29_106222 [Actinoplanes lutulentus]